MKVAVDLWQRPKPQRQWHSGTKLTRTNLGAPLGEVVQRRTAVRPAGAHHNGIEHFAGQPYSQAGRRRTA